MKSNTIPMGNYSFSEADNFLIDTNIWIYLYGPQLPKDWKTTIYSGALARMLAAKSKIWMDVLILSEFINRYCRHECELVSV